MAKEDKPRDLMGYDALQQEALRGVIRAALMRIAPPRGLPGDHHFYISFRTDADMVAVPEDLLARYPEEMTVVLQNQFWDLKVGDTAFSVTLQFSGQPKSLTVPYSAITRFYDPSVQYLLQFSPPSPAPRAPASRREENKASAPRAAEGDGPKIVSLDQFRKK
jgi:hypothetical protein